MSRLPTPGGDDGQWGNILNDFLTVSHNNDGTLAGNSVGSTQVVAGSLPATKLDSATQAKLNNSLQTTNNLSDVTNAATARTNLDAASVESVAAKVDKDTLVYVFNEHGGVADAVELDDIAITVGSNQFTSPSANFSSADIGKVIGFYGPGASGGVLTSSPSNALRTIASVIDAHTATFDDPLHGVALTTVVGPRTCTVTTVRGSQQITSADAAFTASDAGKKITIPLAFGDTLPTVKSHFGQIASGTLTTLKTDAVWTTADVGKYILITGAGASGAPLLAKVTARTSSTQVTIDTAASQAVFGTALSTFTGQGAEVIDLGLPQTYTTRITSVTNATTAIIRRMPDFPATTASGAVLISGGHAAYGTDNHDALNTLLATLPAYATLEFHGGFILGHSNVTNPQPVTFRGRNRKLDYLHSIVTAGRFIQGSSYTTFREIGLRAINGSSSFFGNAPAGSVWTDTLLDRVLGSGISLQLSIQNSVGTGGTITAAGTGHSTRLWLRQVEITDSFGDGLRLTGISDVRIDDIDLHDNGQDVNSSVGMKISSCRRPRVTGARSWLNVGDSMDFYDSQGPQVSNVFAWMNGSHGIDWKWNSAANYNGVERGQFDNCEGSFNYGVGVNLSAPRTAATNIKAIGNASYGVLRSVGSVGTVLSAALSTFNSIEVSANGGYGVQASGGIHDIWMGVHSNQNFGGFYNGGTDTTLIGVKAFDHPVSSTGGNIYHDSNAVRPRQQGCVTSDTNGQFTANASATFILANNYGEEAAGTGNPPTTASWPVGALIKNTSDSTYWHRTFSGWVAGTSA